MELNKRGFLHQSSGLVRRDPDEMYHINLYLPRLGAPRNMSYTCSKFNREYRSVGREHSAKREVIKSHSVK